MATGALVELRSMLRPAADIALFRAEMAAWPGPGELTDWQEGQRDWLETNDDCRRDILEKLYDEGRCRPASCRTRPCCPGSRAVGTTTAADGCCSS